MSTQDGVIFTITDFWMFIDVGNMVVTRNMSDEAIFMHNYVHGDWSHNYDHFLARHLAMFVRIAPLLKEYAFFNFVVRLLPIVCEHIFEIMQSPIPPLKSVLASGAFVTDDFVTSLIVME